MLSCCQYNPGIIVSLYCWILGNCVTYEVNAIVIEPSKKKPFIKPTSTAFAPTIQLLIHFNASRENSRDGMVTELCVNFRTDPMTWKKLSRDSIEQEEIHLRGKEKKHGTF